jgi:hypothetical protein
LIKKYEGDKDRIVAELSRALVTTAWTDPQE